MTVTTLFLFFFLIKAIIYTFIETPFTLKHSIKVITMYKIFDFFKYYNLKANTIKNNFFKVDL